MLQRLNSIPSSDPSSGIEVYVKLQFSREKDRVWELMKKIGICLLASWDGEELQARPMGAYVRPDENAVFFFGRRTTSQRR
jgi:Pyridoxamine 5'-phosphate oxidase like